MCSALRMKTELMRVEKSKRELSACAFIHVTLWINFSFDSSLEADSSSPTFCIIRLHGYPLPYSTRNVLNHDFHFRFEFVSIIFLLLLLLLLCWHIRRIVRYIDMRTSWRQRMSEMSWCVVRSIATKMLFAGVGFYEKTKHFSHSLIHVTIHTHTHACHTCQGNEETHRMKWMRKNKKNEMFFFGIPFMWLCGCQTQ